MLVSKVQALLTNCICFDLVAFELFPVVDNDFLNLLVNPLDVLAAPLIPIFLAIVLYLEDSVRNNFVH